MKKVTLIFICLAFEIFLVNTLNAQCIPGDSLSCPDLENNGQVCPAVMPGATVNQYYNEDFTILAPPVFYDSASGITVNLHHIKLMKINNLPEGITWESNAEDSVFVVGEYYCVLLQGTPMVAGNYPLKIEVDVYVEFFGNQIYLTTATDSTSLTMDVSTTGVNEYDKMSIKLLSSMPNPFFSDLDISYIIAEPQKVTFKIFDLLGCIIYERIIDARYGENHIKFDGSDLNPGLYFYSISDSYNQYTKRVIKSN